MRRGFAVAGIIFGVAIVEGVSWSCWLLNMPIDWRHIAAFAVTNIGGMMVGVATELSYGRHRSKNP